MSAEPVNPSAHFAPSEVVLALRRRRVLGDDHPDTLVSAGDLAAGPAMFGDYQRACDLGEDTLLGRRRVLGENHPDTLVMANNVAVELRLLGHY